MAIDTRDAVIEKLGASVRGEIVTPADPAYDEARRVWNAMIDMRPAAVIRCSGAADVIAGVNAAREHGLPIAVRSGAHGIAGTATCDEGIVLDLGPMKGVRVDPAARTVWAQPGLRWQDFDGETQAFGLATTGGTVGDTGIGGLTLGGGFGWLAGKYGMTVDNLLGADVVTAEGELVHTSADEHPDLFWAIRGGGGNFGVVTAFEYGLHQVGPMITGGAIFHPISAAREVLHFYREFADSAADELTVYAALTAGPDGNPVVAVAAAHCGPLEDGETALEPLRKFGSPLADMLGPIPYVGQQSLLGDTMPPGLHNYWKADFMDGISDEVIDLAIESFSRAPSPRSLVLFVPINGVASRVPVEATAFPHRGGLCHFGIYSLFTDPAEAEQNIVWTRELWSAIQPFAKCGVYVNELGEDEGDDRVRLAYGPNYERLASVKAQYDPENIFRLNANIRPAVS